MKRSLLLAVFLIGTLGLGASAQSVQDQKNDSPGEKGKMAVKKEGSGFVSATDAAKWALKAGDKMPEFNLPNVKKENVSSSDLLKRSNLVVVFYRGAWCPYCNLYLKRLQGSLQDFKKNGGELVAISVENPDNSLSVAEKNKLEFTVLSDKNLDLARKFRLVYQLDPETNEKYKGYGIDLVKNNGTETPDLPISATYIVDKGGNITFAFIDPDYTKRLEAKDIISELQKIRK
ncbi:MAG: AhpC/TSA family protein [Acidobacteria bacterium]|nr:AhpC/TSA family protein [Acidobacteriota bacterium]